MTEKTNPAALVSAPTRRQAIAGVAGAVCALAAAPRVWGAAQRGMPETESTGADRLRTFLHQEVDLKAGSQRIYQILLDSKLFAAFSGEPATISKQAGGTFSMFGARIVGRNVELVPNQRIVQAWRPASWDPGVYSVVKFELKEKGSQTTVVLDHTGFPEGDFGHLNDGWKEHYWERLAKYLG